MISNLKLNRIIDNISDKKIVFSLFFATFILKTAYSIYAYLDDVFVHFKDDAFYYDLAYQIVESGNIFYMSANPVFDIIGPGLPWILALSILIPGNNWLGIFIINSLVSAFITIFTYKVCRFTINKTTALFAGIWSGIYLFYFKFVPTAGKDIWMSFFMIILIFLLLQLFYYNRFTYLKYLLFIFLFAYSFHLDERYFMFSPLIVLYVLSSETLGFQKTRISKTLVFLGLTALLTLPWTIRNFMKYDKIILLSSRTERLTDALFGYENRKLHFDYITDLYGPYYIHEYQIDSVLSGEKKVTDGGYRISEAQRQFMLRGNLPHEFSFIEAFWVRVKSLLRPFQLGGEYQKTGYFFYKKSFRHNVASFLFYGIMFFFSIPGFYKLYHDKRHIFFVFITVIIYYTLIHALFVPWTTWRYRLPLDSLYIIAGSYGLINVYNLIRKFKSAKAT